MNIKMAEENGIDQMQETMKEMDKSKKTDRSYLLPVSFMVFLFIISIGFSLMLAPIFLSLNLQADFSELGGEESLWIPFFYLAVILIFTAVILFITRKRKGRFIKYGFLMVITISIGYVFYAIFSAIFFPIPPQKWSGSLELDGDVTYILTADLLDTEGWEIIIGTNQGNVYVYDNHRNLLWHSSETLNGPITDLEVIDLNNDELPELVAVGKIVNIYNYTKTGTTYTFRLAWSSSSINMVSDFTSSTVLYRSQFTAENGSKSVSSLFVTYGSKTNELGEIFKILYINGSYQIKQYAVLPTPIFSITSGYLGDTDQQLYIGSIGSIYSLAPDEENSTPQRKFLNVNITGNIIGLQIANIDDKTTPELIAWDDNGIIYIFEKEKLKKRIKDFKGKILGGVYATDTFDWLDGDELVVSTGGKVYIYNTRRKLFDNNWEFTEETGRLDKVAKGLAAGYMDNNDELELLVGNAGGVKFYHYIEPEYSDTPCIMGAVVAVILSVALFKYPEWYLVDLIGIFVAAGVTALLGVSIGLLPLIVLLIIFAVYDAISVYKTKHMVSLADKVMEFKLPILLVVPKKRGYSFIQQKGLKKQLDDGEEREAMFIGLGDIIIPGTLVISSFTFLPMEVGWFGLGTNLLVAIFTLVGILFGFTALMHFVLKGNPQAGLPLLNTGAILGFILSYILIYQDFTFGMTLPFG